MVMKVFISQPMNNRSTEEIEEERRQLITKIESSYGKVEVLDSFFKDFDTSTAKNPPLAYFAKGMAVLAEADIACFGAGWEKARGCIMEHQIACVYGLKVIQVEE